MKNDFWNADNADASNADLDEFLNNQRKSAFENLRYQRSKFFILIVLILSSCSVTKPKGPYSNYVGQVIKTARTYTGTPYKSGGNDRSGIDCSGLICSTFSDIGIKVPRISWQQSEFGKEVTKISDIRAGDWVFFVPESGQAGYVSHSGIVTEVKSKTDIRFIHASSSRGVREDNLFSSYFKNRFAKAMRPF